MTAPENASRLEPYDAIREAIIRGQYTARQHLVETELTERFMTNRAVVREAFARLEHEGLVVKRENKGVYVRAVDLSEAVEVLEARTVLEGFMARRAAANATKEDVARLRALNTELHQLEGSLDLARFRVLNAQFHERINALGNHRTTHALIESLNARIYAQYRDRALLTPGRIKESVREHRVVIDALRKHDGDAAEQAMRTHLEATVSVIRSGLGQISSLPGGV